MDAGLAPCSALHCWIDIFDKYTYIQSDYQVQLTPPPLLRQRLNSARKYATNKSQKYTDYYSYTYTGVYVLQCHASVNSNNQLHNTATMLNVRKNAMETPLNPWHYCSRARHQLLSCKDTQQHLMPLLGCIRAMHMQHVHHPCGRNPAAGCTQGSVWRAHWWLLHTLSWCMYQLVT